MTTRLMARSAEHTPPPQDTHDVLVIDDQPSQQKGWLDAYLPGVRHLKLTSLDQTEQFLRGSYENVPGLPPGPYHPALALVDLFLDDRGRAETGLSVLHLLRTHPDPTIRELPAVLNTNHTTGHGALLATLAADVNGGAILLSRKAERDGPRVQALLTALLKRPAETAQLGVDPSFGLALIKGVTVIGGSNKKPQQLLRVLLGREWKRRYWMELGKHGDSLTATVIAKDLVGRDKTAQQAIHSKVTTELSAVPLALDVLSRDNDGGSFLELPDGILDLDAAERHPLYEGIKADRMSLVKGFAQTYASVLQSMEIHALAEGDL